MVNIERDRGEKGNTQAGTVSALFRSGALPFRDEMFSCQACRLWGRASHRRQAPTRTRQRAAGSIRLCRVSLRQDLVNQEEGEEAQEGSLFIPR